MAKKYDEGTIVRIKVRDGEYATVRKLDPKTMRPNTWNLKSIPEQAFRDKLGRSKAWTVLDSKLDLDGKKFKFNIAIGPNDKAEEITFDDAAKMFGWDSIEVKGGDHDMGGVIVKNYTVYPKFTIED